MRGRRILAAALVIAQAALAWRVFARMFRTAQASQPILPDRSRSPERVSVIVPVLDEVQRLGPCLRGLHAQGAEVAEVLVVDGGSTDGTPDLVRAWEVRDLRIRLVEAGPAPDGENGKAHNLAAGLAASDPENPWVLTVDADVRPRPGLVTSLLAHARRSGSQALSVATMQALSGPAEALVHPSMLATLVYRFGVPGSATVDPAQVQANGQAMLVRRRVLEEVGGFSPLAHEIVEDVALARRIAAAGQPVGFHEAGDLVTVEMYGGPIDALRNWTRSLPMRDGTWGPPGVLGLLEVILVQALPLPLALLLGWRGGAAGRVGRFEAALAIARIGVLAGVARAYRSHPWPYWVSPVTDVPVALAITFQAFRRRHAWRGRTVVRGGPR